MCPYMSAYRSTTGADPGFQAREAHLKKMCRAEGGAKIVEIFRVKNHDFTPKKHFFPILRGARAGCSPLPWTRPCTILTIFNRVIQS